LFWDENLPCLTKREESDLRSIEVWNLSSLGNWFHRLGWVKRGIKRSPSALSVYSVINFVLHFLGRLAKPPGFTHYYCPSFLRLTTFPLALRLWSSSYASCRIWPKIIPPRKCDVWGATYDTDSGIIKITHLFLHDLRDSKPQTSQLLKNTRSISKRFQKLPEWWVSISQRL